MEEVKKLAETISANLKTLELDSGDTRIVWKDAARANCANGSKM
jgi:hypothetical protein